VFSNNMADKTEPEITSYSGSDFTCITFKPDWDRFTMDGLESDTEALLRKRVHDIAGCMSGYGGKKVKVRHCSTNSSSSTLHCFCLQIALLV
jgi:DNA topoisomerase II